MKTLLASTLVLAAAFAAAAATSVSADALSERLDSSAMSDAAFQQLVAGAGIVEDQTRQVAASDIAEIRRRGD